MGPGQSSRGSGVYGISWNPKKGRQRYTDLLDNGLEVPRRSSQHAVALALVGPLLQVSQVGVDLIVGELGGLGLENLHSWRLLCFLPQTHMDPLVNQSIKPFLLSIEFFSCAARSETFRSLAESLRRCACDPAMTLNPKENVWRGSSGSWSDEPFFSFPDSYSFCFSQPLLALSDLPQFTVRLSMECISHDKPGLVRSS
jgi:hypothetical protein